MDGLLRNQWLPSTGLFKSCRERTSTLLIVLKNYNDKQLEEILAVTVAVAGKVVEVTSPDDLAGVWAALIPRRQIA